MRKSIGMLGVDPTILLVDGNKADIKHYKQENIIYYNLLKLSANSNNIDGFL